MSEDYLIEHASPVQNGFSSSESINLENLDAAELKLHSCVHISGSIIQELETAKTTELTRGSISHFESIFQVGVLAELRVISPEMLLSLGTSTPHSAKIHATLAHQQPEFYQQLMEVMSQIKQAAVTESEKKASDSMSVSHTSTATSVNVTLKDGDELSISVKKARTSAA
eukprot:1587032-Amphidinium_carterae.1